jgi:hypothetical protein
MYTCTIRNAVPFYFIKQCLTWPIGHAIIRCVKSSILVFVHCTVHDTIQGRIYVYNVKKYWNQTNCNIFCQVKKDFGILKVKKIRRKI